MAKKKAPTPRPNYEGGIARSNANRLKGKVKAGKKSRAKDPRGGRNRDSYDSEQLKKVAEVGKKAAKKYSKYQAQAVMQHAMDKTSISAKASITRERGKSASNTYNNLSKDEIKKRAKAKLKGKK